MTLIGCAPWTMGSSVIFVNQSMNSICDGVFTPLSRRFHAGQGELKYGAASFIRLCPQPAPMGVDDRPANRQPHPHAAGLRGVKCIEHALEMRRIDARPGIAHCHKDASVVLFGADQ